MLPGMSDLPKLRKWARPGRPAVAVVDLPDPANPGKYHRRTLGPWGSRKAADAYARLAAELGAGGLAVSTGRGAGGTTVEALAGAYVREREERGDPEAAERWRALFPLVELFGGRPARDMGPPEVEAAHRWAARHRVVTRPDGGHDIVERPADKPLSRTTVRKRHVYIVAAFKWGLRHRLVPAEAAGAIALMGPPRRGEVPGLKEARRTGPADPLSVDTVIAWLRSSGWSPTLADMLEVHRLTGMRSDALCDLRPAWIDRTRIPWTYKRPEPSRPRKADRTFLGRRVRAILERRCGPGLADWPADKPVFSPAAVRAEQLAAMRAARRTRVQPSQQARAKPDAKRRPGERFESESYARATANAVARYNRSRAADAPEAVPWTPHALRRLWARTVRDAGHGLKAASVLLAHGDVEVTERRYTGEEVQAARDAAEDLG
jgi:integrase